MSTRVVEAAQPRPIRSFVLRSGRVTGAQQRALAELWPRYGIEFSPQLLDLDAVFGRRAARVLEIGFGNGENLIALAHSRPDKDYLGVEVHRSGVGRLLMAVDATALTNVKVICHDAVQVLAQQLAVQAFDEILILFPDPWPKKRHHKRRLIQPAFAELLASRLKAGGTLRLATDWRPYAEQMLEVLVACSLLENLTSPGGRSEPGERIATRFEQRGRRLGHDVWDFAFQRRG